MFSPNLKSIALPIPEIISIGVLGEGCEPQSWGRGGRRGSGMVPFERALVSSYRPSIVTFPLFTYFRDIAVFVLQHATFSHPTSSLPKIPPYSPRSRWMAFGLRRAKVSD